MEDGVWRTVGGRRIFIKDGESLSEAMKKSGKFTNKKDIEHQKKKLANDVEKGAFTSEREREEKWKDYDALNELSKMSDEELKEKYMNISQEERVKAYEEGKNWKDLVKEKDKSSSIKSQQSDIEKASGLKVEKAFETDAFGTGKEDRFQLSDGRYIAHSTESMGQKEDSWSINKVEGGNIKSQEFKSYDDMIEHLSGSSEGRSDTSKNSSSSEIMFKDKGTYGKYARGEVIGETKINGEKGYVIKDTDGNEHKIPDSKTLKMRGQNEVAASKGTKVQFVTGNNEKGTIVRELSGEEIRKENDYLYTYSPQTRMYEVKLDNGKTEIVGDHVIKREGSKFTLSEEGEQKRKTVSNAYKKAYQEYKKAHPNSKISLDKFIDISEGK